MQIVALTAFSVMSQCDLDIWHTNLKIHRVNAQGTAYIPAKFRRNSLKNNREIRIQRTWKLMNGHFLFCVPVTLTFDLRIPKYIQLFYKSLSTNGSNLREIGWKTAEKWWNTRRTDFQRLSPRNLDLCSMTMQMHRDTVLSISIHQPSFNKIG